MDDFSFRPLGEIMVSPDGSRFVLAGLLGDAPIHWRNADEENFRPIAGTEGAEYAAFSPDGQTLVFGPTAGGTIYRVAISGGGLPSPWRICRHRRWVASTGETTETSCSR